MRKEVINQIVMLCIIGVFCLVVGVAGWQNPSLFGRGYGLAGFGLFTTAAFIAGGAGSLIAAFLKYQHRDKKYQPRDKK